MFNLHKRRLRAIRVAKKRNCNKEGKTIKHEGTGTFPLPGTVYGITPLKQYFVDNNLPKRIVIKEDLDYYDSHETPHEWLGYHGDWNRKEPFNIPVDQRVHDRTRWKRNKIKPKEEIGKEMKK